MSDTLDVHPSDILAPSAGDSIRHAGHTLLEHVVVFVLVGLAVFAAGVVTHLLADSDGAAALVGIAAVLLISRPLDWGFRFMCLRAARGEAPHAEDVLRPFDHYREVVLANVLVLGMVLVGLCLLIVPGVIVYLRTRFVQYLVVEDGLDAVAAIRESFELTEAVSMTLLRITGAGWLGVIIGSIPLGLGILPAVIWWDLSIATLYHTVKLCDEGAEIGEPLPDASIA